MVLTDAWVYKMEICAAHVAERKANNLGELGWELVSVVPSNPLVSSMVMWFKRPV